jgi:hypothetical protein
MIKTAHLLLLMFVLSMVLLALSPAVVTWLCGSNNCGLCAFIGHHIDMIKNFSLAIINLGGYLLLAVVFIISFIFGFLLWECFRGNLHERFKLYNRYTLFNSAHSLSLNPLALAYSDGVIKTKIEKSI